MNSTVQTISAVVVGLILSTTWVVISRLSIQGDPFFWAISAQYFFAALVGLVMQAVFEKRVPHLSLKLLQSAITIGVVCFWLPSITYFSALRELPSVIPAMTFTMIPLWFWMFRIGRGTDRPIFLLLTTAGTILFYLGTSGFAKVTEHHLILLAALLVSSFLCAMGMAFSKKIFWIHSPKGLAFWSMMVASLLSAMFAMMQEDFSISAWSTHRWLDVAYLGIVATGLMAYGYRYLAAHAKVVPTILMTLMMPVGALIITYLTNPSQISWNAYSILGMLMYSGAVFFAARSENPIHWLSHFLNNSRRQGDRVSCHIKGFMKKEKGPIANIEVKDLSIGGLGFSSDTEFQVADVVFVSFPLGRHWTQITFECQIMHRHKTSDAQHPWSGGVEFRHLEEATRQTLVEFLAKIGRPAIDAA